MFTESGWAPGTNTTLPMEMKYRMWKCHDWQWSHAAHSFYLYVLSPELLQCTQALAVHGGRTPVLFGL